MVSETVLTDQDVIEMRWMQRANASGCGLYAQIVRRLGPVPECEALVERGLATLRNGYWITDAGREALNDVR